MKKMNKKGFTLAELLIVVAIIAVLVAIAIPVFSTQLEKSRETTDMANLRSAYAAATVYALANSTTNGEVSWYVPTADGAVSEATGNTSIGQGTATDGKAVTAQLPGGVEYGTGSNVKNSEIRIQFGSGSVSKVSFGS